MFPEHHQTKVAYALAHIDQHGIIFQICQIEFAILQPMLFDPNNDQNELKSNPDKKFLAE